MLVTFSTPAYADITLFGDVAVSLLKMMGHSGTVPSALLAEDVQAALEQLQAAIEREGQHLTTKEDDDETAVTLSQRALPVIELLKAAKKEKCNVMWDRY